MQVIALVSRKGGAGKTTVACHLAVEAERAGRGPVAIIDTDPMQGLAQWWDARHADTPMLVRPEPDLQSALKALRSHGAKIAIIDTPPAVSADVSAVVAAADLVVVPVQPSPDDLRAVAVTVAMVERAKKSLVFVINRTKPRARLTGEAAIALSQHGTVSSTQLADRIDYAAAKTDGLTAPELEPGGRAAAEIAALWSYIARKLGKDHVAEEATEPAE
jgi:chromosome partitioning protein